MDYKDWKGKERVCEDIDKREEMGRGIRIWMVIIINICGISIGSASYDYFIGFVFLFIPFVCFIERMWEMMKDQESYQMVDKLKKKWFIWPGFWIQPRTTCGVCLYIL